MIYVQIAAYRDPELIPTIEDCLAKAKYPNDLTFGICWQKAEDDHSLDRFANERRFRIDTVPWHKSQGLCWARSRIQGMYEGEDYTLQIDSHHRFVPEWDVRLLEYLELTGSRKPILTSYGVSYNPKSPLPVPSAPYKMLAKGFTPGGTIIFHPDCIHEWQQLAKPIRARFVSGHFFFTLGGHCEEYKYDPNLYFAGDEISLSIRSFTRGYDLFHPHRTVIWHEYTRQGRRKHWDDHVPQNQELVDRTWHERNGLSLKRVRKLLREEKNDEDIAGYDLGTMRSHRDYELYAGIDFAGRRLHRDTWRGAEPPSAFVNEEEWAKAFLMDHQVTLRWEPEHLDQCEDLSFIYFGVQDGMGREIYRYDAKPDSPEASKQIAEKRIQIRAADKPAKLVVWPMSKSRGWLRSKVYRL
ncbi:MAG: GlcNAc-transferase family protein [Chthoniobacter sp.]